MEQSEAVADPTVASGKHCSVHQATGVLVAQFAINPDAALEKLRAVAAESARPVVDVAREIVENSGL